ncbi:hypothetical protein MMC25_001540 [Agyrium rufum]|nr:hypothetical protein [Agyrium rufum]
MKATIPIYQDDISASTQNVKVEGVFPVSAAQDKWTQAHFKDAPSDSYFVITDKTIFYAQGGGQPFDTGTMSTISQDGEKMTTLTVAAVRKNPTGTIYHLGTFSPSATTFQPGEIVQQEIDVKKRLLHSRIHTGGHIVGLAVQRLVKQGILSDITDRKAQHYPDAAFVDFEGLIDGSHKASIEREANDIVKLDLPVKAYKWSLQEAREKCVTDPEVAGIPEGELIRAVDVQGEGAYACGGTYALTTGIIGPIVIRKIKRAKGITKISYSV